ncbi:VCBS repeat-containing protein [Nostoc linckia NIES-25]|nr:VCBS repeat-containing protein [Nostoc linckia NIES-25]
MFELSFDSQQGAISNPLYNHAGFRDYQDPLYALNPSNSSQLLPEKQLIIDTVIQSIYATKDILVGLSSNSKIDEIMGIAFGESYQKDLAIKILADLEEKDFINTPGIKIISGQTFNGAYAKEKNTIYLSEEFVADNLGNVGAVTGVLLEEFGHYFDGQINVKDAAGDEGDIFSRLVQEQSISGGELLSLKVEDDSKFITVDGQEILVEQNTFQNQISSSPGFTKNNGGWTTSDDYPRMLADVNGDGRADIVGFGASSVFVSLSNGNGTFQNSISSSPGFTKNNGGWTNNNDYPRMLADVNGDGRADIVGFGASSVFVSLSNGNGTFQNSISSSPGFTKNNGGWTNNNDYPRMLADVNGDGRADIVGFGASSVFVSLSNGNGTFQNSISSSPGFTKNNGGWTNNNDYPRMLADVNGDSRADIVGFGADSIFVSLSNGNGTFQNSISSSPGFTKNNGGWTNNNDYPRMLADVNGDRRADIVGFGANQVFSSFGQTSVTADYAGNSTGAARNIGTLGTSNSSYSDWVGGADTNDYYRFYLDGTRNLRLSMSGLSADADVEVLNASGVGVGASRNSGTTSETIDLDNLAAGTYYARVYRYSGDTYYNLSLRGETIVPLDYAGNTTGAARNIGTLNSYRSFGDWVGSLDGNDYYRFDVGTQTNFSLSLTGLSADADVQLLDISGNFISASGNSGSNSESITRQLSAGIYFVRVYSYNATNNTNYSLSLSGASLSSQIRSGSDNVNLWLYDTNGRNTTGYINPNRETVVVIHGWNNSDQSRYVENTWVDGTRINKLAREAAEFGTQVIALDWGGIAADPNELDSWLRDAVPDETAQWITPVAQWTKNLLVSLGISSNQLTLIGHSLGTYVSSEIARMYGQVRNIVALDPAWSPSGYDLDINTPGTQGPVDFRNVAQYSLAFVVGDDDAGAAGDNNKAATAHDSFIIQGWSGTFVNAIDAHGAVVDLFRNALDRRLLSPTNLAMPFHQNDWYNNDGNRDFWLWDNGQHEGYINASFINGDWRIAGLRIVVDSSGTEQWKWT